MLKCWLHKVVMRNCRSWLRTMFCKSTLAGGMTGVSLETNAGVQDSWQETVPDDGESHDTWEQPHCTHCLILSYSFIPSLIHSNSFIHSGIYICYGTMDGADFNNAWHDLYNPLGEKNMHMNDGSSELLFSPSPHLFSSPTSPPSGKLKYLLYW